MDRPPATLGSLLTSAAGRWPSLPALVVPGATYSYAELASRAEQVARNLVGLGIEPGERVGVFMPNGVEFVSALFGVALAGAVCVPMNTRFRAVELRFLVDHAGLVTVLTTDEMIEHVDLYGRLCETYADLAGARDPTSLRLDDASTLRSVVLLGARDASGAIRAERFAELGSRVDVAEVRDRSARIGSRDTTLMLYTSGTTAEPSGCLLGHGALIGVWAEVARRLGVGVGDCVWNPCPYFHMAGSGITIACAAAGATALTASHFDPDIALGQIDSCRPTALYPAFPPITLALLNHARFAEVDMSSVRSMLNVAPPETLRQMQEALPGAVQVSLFGMTETSGPATFGHIGDPLDVRLGTCGDPLPGLEVRVVDPTTGACLPPGEYGEIQIRGYSVCQGYQRDPDKTAAMIDGDGWLRTGDRGVIDGAGRLTYSGRLKDMLKVGGENVSPAELEAQIGAHPAVHIAQVVGAPDQRLQEVVAAFVELKPGAELTETDLLAYLRPRVASFKLPRHVRFTTDWPMSATKIQKSVLREQLITELESVASPAAHGG